MQHLDSSRLDVGVIGTGRVGAVLGAALARAGHRVVAASGSSTASLAGARVLLPGVPLVPPADVARRCGLLLLCAPDDALAGLAPSLAGDVRPGQLVAHVSGAHGLSVLRPLSDRGALPLALHPVLPFTGTALDLDRLAGASFGVTTPEALRAVGEALVLEMGGEPVWVPDRLRPLWHAALAHGANHLVALVAQSTDLLRSAGVEDPAGVLGPLLGAALDGALRTGDAALTGPVARGDAGTVRAHLAALPDHARPAYVAMARLTADRALAAGRLDPLQAGALLDVLGGAGRDGVVT